MDSQTEIIPVELSDGTIIKVEATPIGEQRISSHALPFKETTAKIKSVAQEVAATVRDIRQEVKPNKFSVTIGVEIGIESGQLTTLIVKGSGKGNLEITMEWDE